MFTIKIKRSFIPLTGVIICAYFLFTMPESVTKGVTEGLKICFFTVLPSLFPFMVLASYIVKSDILAPVCKLFSPVTKFLFRQPACASPVIIMALIGGFPIGAKMTLALFESGKITENQAKRLNLFCVNCGPAFAVTAVGASIFQSTRAGCVIYLSLCLSSVMLGILTSFLADKNETVKEYSTSPQSPLASLSASVSDSVQAVLSICAWIVLFSALTSCIDAYEMNATVKLAVTSLIEITKGCTVAAGKFSVPVITAIIGFGGFCVHCQIFSFMRPCGLKYKYFFASRALNAALSSFICEALLAVIPVDITTAALASPITPVPFSVSLPAVFALGVMCIVMIFDIDTKKKLW